MSSLRIILSRCLVLLALALPPLALAGAAPAQNLFSPAVYVNDRVITHFEIEQNMRFLQLLGQRGDLRDIAIDRLIEDRLRLDAAAAMGITAAEEEIQAGMAEFAGRANLTTDQFLAELGNIGVAPETFHDFVEAGLLWRKVVSARFAPRAQVTDAEIDRAIALAGRRSGVRVLLSELVLPANTPLAKTEAEATAARLGGQSMSESAFAIEARERSVSGSRDNGGRLDWMEISDLPPPVASQVLTMAPGQVSQPFPVTNAIVLFYLRDMQETGLPQSTALALDWAEIDLESREQGARIRAQAPGCDDLYGAARDIPEDRFRRETRAAGAVPRGIALELAKLDENESVLLDRPGAPPMLLMLCGRTYELTEGEGPSREEVRTRLLTQRITTYADGYLAELKADANIRYP